MRITKEMVGKTLRLRDGSEYEILGVSEKHEKIWVKEKDGEFETCESESDYYQLVEPKKKPSDIFIQKLTAIQPTAFRNVISNEMKALLELLDERDEQGKP